MQQGAQVDAGAAGAGQLAEQVMSAGETAFSEDDRGQLRASVTAANSALQAATARFLRLINFAFAITAVAWAAAAIVAQWWTDLAWHGVGFGWATVVGPATAAFIVVWFYAVPSFVLRLVTDRNRGSHDHEPPGAPTMPLVRWLGVAILAVNLLGMLVAAVWCGAWVLSGGLVGLAQSIAFVFGGLIVAVGVVGVPFTVISYRWSRMDPRDELIVGLAGFYVVAAQRGERLASDLATVPRSLGRDAARWRIDRNARAVFGTAIARAARRVEDRLHQVAPGSESQIRADLRKLGTGIATTLRQHARDVIIGGVERDDDVAERLRIALAAAAWGRWEELATDSQTPGAQRFLRKFGARMLTAFVLATVGILGPVLFRDELGSVGQQLRITLLVAAALVLVETPKSALDKVAEFLKGR
ncbi:hypothetical protein [Dactylosporangium sp. CA-092794]|uniref:hypothetical protein n=1 Tax=Dactylosporangium sp. CA-092794 TaxID=3239929 RepID=UPI003D8D107F